MRQRREVDDQRVAGDVFAEEDRNLHLLGSAVGFFDHFAEADELAVFVGHFDADGVLAGDRGDDADARHAEGDRQVVGQARDLRQPQAGFELDFVLGDDRAGFDFDDVDVEAEVVERLFQNLGLAADFFFLLLVAHVFAGQQQFERRQLVVFRCRRLLASFIFRISSARSRSAASFLRSLGFFTRSGLFGLILATAPFGLGWRRFIGCRRRPRAALTGVSLFAGCRRN